MTNRQFEDPQTVDSARADKEWKADPAADNIVHGGGDTGSEIDRSYKAADLPEEDPDTSGHTASGSGIEVIGGQGSSGGPGLTGSGKGGEEKK